MERYTRTAAPSTGLRFGAGGLGDAVPQQTEGSRRGGRNPRKKRSRSTDDGAFSLVSHEGEGLHII